MVRPRFQRFSIEMKEFHPDPDQEFVCMSVPPGVGLGSRGSESGGSFNGVSGD